MIQKCMMAWSVAMLVMISRAEAQSLGRRPVKTSDSPVVAPTLGAVLRLPKAASESRTITIRAILVPSVIRAAKLETPGSNGSTAVESMAVPNSTPSRTLPVVRRPPKRG